MDLDLPTWDEFDDWNLDYYEEEYQRAYALAVKDGYSDEAGEGIADDARDKITSETYMDWSKSIARTINYLLGFHHLKLVLEEKKVYIKATEPWEKAASQTAETITGYGPFVYTNAEGLRAAGPYLSYCEAVIKHLHWFRRYPDVYGEKDYRRIYEVV